MGPGLDAKEDRNGSRHAGRMAEREEGIEENKEKGWNEAGMETNRQGVRQNEIR